MNYLLVFLFSMAFGQQSEFCEGFEKGYKSVKGTVVVVPVCPVAPVPGPDSDYYLEGVKKGAEEGEDDDE